ncbi:hypothetical protein [Dysgonomonas sp. 520]|uniref:ISAon1 family transposase N-terminal region protein n=1 Tax=Dysgonomonas sp. 520 TaxID=2302931 RepID=UPI0013D0F485|nr:hypothetical protein [Dysgonomonas sp. 520]NDW11142.1 hypothetical protein [Dysgonomonas sp. 520]
MYQDGYSLLLPCGLLDYFSILKVEDSKAQIKIYLEEKNNLDNPQYESKGFYPNVLVNDFPVRGKTLLLDLRRRRWIHKQTGEYFNRNLHLIAEGTRITQEFASFLKGLHR